MEKSRRTHFGSLFIDRNTVVIKFLELNILREELITDNICRIQDNGSIMCGFIVLLS